MSLMVFKLFFIHTDVTFIFLGTRLKKVITGLEENLDIKTKEAEHLQSLVAKMEATPGQDEMNKVQISDLKVELAKSEESLKIRTEELLQVRKDLRTKDEEIQQREIDISCLRGQVDILLEVNEKITLVGSDDDTLTPDADTDHENDVLLEDLEWDPDSSAIKLET